jgi:FkbM family methyltransferase
VSTHHPDHAPDDIDRAHYLHWSRTWAALARRSFPDHATVEGRLVEFFRKLCLRISPSVVLEVGAHEATFSRWAAHALPDARVTAFEANPYVHEKFADRLARTRVEYLNLCVGPVNGEVELHLPKQIRGEERSLASKMASLNLHTLADEHVQVSVPSVRLDDRLDLSPDDRVVMWIDVEGATQTVLEGSGTVLDRTRALIVEVENQAVWEGQWLDTDVAAHLRRNGMVPVARDVAARPHRYNVVYVRAEEATDIRTARQAAGVLRRPNPSGQSERD